MHSPAALGATVPDPDPVAALPHREALDSRRPPAPVPAASGGRAGPDFGTFVATRAETLVRTARGLLRDPQHAEDVVQDVLVKAHQRWASIAQMDHPEAYIRRMLVNEATSFWRRAVRREFATERLPDPAIEDGSADRAERDLLLALIRRLPARQRAVLVLRHYEGLPDEEIAELLGSAPVTVRSNASRGLATLRRLLAEYEGNADG